MVYVQHIPYVIKLIYLKPNNSEYSIGHFLDGALQQSNNNSASEQHEWRCNNTQSIDEKRFFSSIKPQFKEAFRYGRSTQFWLLQLSGDLIILIFLKTQSIDEKRFFFSRQTPVQGPLEKWIEHFTRFHFMKLQLRGGLKRNTGAPFY